MLSISLQLQMADSLHMRQIHRVLRITNPSWQKSKKMAVILDLFLTVMEIDLG